MWFGAGGFCLDRLPGGRDNRRTATKRPRGGTRKAAGLPLVFKTLVGLVLAGAALSAPSGATADPPSNDAYLLSTVIAQSETTGSQPAIFENAVDTTDATTQTDLFNPDPFGTVTTGG